MKKDIDCLEETYASCRREGKFREKIVDIELVKSLKGFSEKSLAYANRKSKDIPKDSIDWTFVFRDHYEALRGLIEAFLLLEGLEAESHQCKNAYVCREHPELGLDWNFLEAIRLKRNAINYRGHLLRYEDWQPLRFKFELHFSLLRREIEKRLEEH